VAKSSKKLADEKGKGGDTALNQLLRSVAPKVGLMDDDVHKRGQAPAIPAFQL
jgi:hypothetical protein